MMLDIFFQRCYTCTVAPGEEIQKPFRQTEVSHICHQETQRPESRDIQLQDADAGLDMLITDSILRELHEHAVYLDTPGLVRRRLSFAEAGGAEAGGGGLEMDSMSQEAIPFHDWSLDTSDDSIANWLQASTPDSAELSLQPTPGSTQKLTLARRLGLATPAASSESGFTYSRRSSLASDGSLRLSPVPVERSEDDWSVHLTLPAAWQVAHQLAMLRDQSMPPTLTFAAVPTPEEFEHEIYDVPPERQWNDPGHVYPMLSIRAAPQLLEKGHGAIPHCSKRLPVTPSAGHLSLVPLERSEEALFTRQAHWQLSVHQNQSYALVRV
mmetsp:Transcript_43800/g.103552  ORF Transcript_43800/g.103552 Transcript_43800/m.103552 type:complete len:325 (+) Transcript_43800:90-1064(+)